MPIVFTEELIKSSEQVEAGWSKMKFLDVRETAKDGFTNFAFEFEALGGPNNGDTNTGRRFAHLVFGKSIAPGSSIPSVVEDLLKLTAALLNTSLDEVKKLTGELDYKKLSGREIWIEVTDFTKDGKLYKQAKTFLPGDVQPGF